MFRISSGLFFQFFHHQFASAMPVFGMLKISAESDSPFFFSFKESQPVVDVRVFWV